MRLKTLFLAGALVLGLTQLSYGQGGTIVGSKHDFSLTSNAWNWSTPVTAQIQGQICRPCHAPHNSNGGQLNGQGLTNSGSFGPLWDHSLSSATYTLYSGYNFSRSDMSEGGVTIGTPDGSSKLCLSCHDGTVALANFRTFTAAIGTMANFDGGVANLGTDLSTTHPVSFTYDYTLYTNDSKLNDPTATPSGVHGGTIDQDMLEYGKVQCISCHDPHNGAGVNHLLIKSNVGSALCFTCHKI